MNIHPCNCATPLEFDIKMAFQPIVDVKSRQVVAYEALVRGVNGESAFHVLSKVNDENKYSFDQTCRVRAIETFASLNSKCTLNINFMPQAIYEPKACLAKTLRAAKRCGLPIANIHFEITEHEQVVSHDFLVEILTAYKKQGFKTAIDDFGAGFSGLNLLSGFQPDYIKLDMLLTRNIDKNPAKQAIIHGILIMCERLNIQLLAEGIETHEEYLYLKNIGIVLMQGYLFAKPALEELPEIKWSLLD
ncbi:EAL domain-containing protein [Thalassotalea marina]